jgi:hypothetical protein
MEGFREGASNGWGHEDKVREVGEEREKIGGDGMETGKEAKLLTAESIGGPTRGVEGGGWPRGRKRWRGGWGPDRGGDGALRQVQLTTETGATEEKESRKRGEEEKMDKSST